MQTSQKYQLQAVPVNGTQWTPVIAPFVDVATVRITNTDIASDLQVCTDTSDAMAVKTVAAGAVQEIKISIHRIRGWKAGETICYLQGSGSAPIVEFIA